MGLCGRRYIRNRGFAFSLRLRGPYSARRGRPTRVSNEAPNSAPTTHQQRDAVFRKRTATASPPPPERQTRKAAVRPVYYARVWQSDDGCPPLGLALAFALCLMAAAGIGAALGALAHLAYVVVLFPLIVGVLLGAAGVAAVRLGHVRNAAIAMTLGLISALACVMVMHLVAHIQYVARSPEFANRDFVNWFILEATGPGIGALRRADPMLPLRELGSWGARLADLVIMGVVAAVLMRMQAVEPYDPYVRMWKLRREIGTVHGTGQQVVGAFLCGRLDRVAALQHDRGMPVRVFMWGAPLHEDQSTVEVELLQPEPGSSGHVEWVRLVRVSYPYRALPDIGLALERRVPPMTRKARKKRAPFPKPKQTRKGITHRHLIKPALVPKARTTRLLYKNATRVHRITSGRVAAVNSAAAREELQSGEFDPLTTMADARAQHVVPPPPPPAERPVAPKPGDDEWKGPEPPPTAGPAESTEDGW